MIKHFCDCCGDQITRDNKVELPCSIQLRFKTGCAFVHIAKNHHDPERFMPPKGGDHDLCKYCIADAVSREIDDRPRAA